MKSLWWNLNYLLAIMTVPRLFLSFAVLSLTGICRETIP